MEKRAQALFNPDPLYLIQKLIIKPFLIGGKTFKMKVYGLMTCCNPMTLYTYEEGIARMSKNKFNLADIVNNEAES